MGFERSSELEAWGAVEKMEKEYCTAVVLAAGQGRRMGTKVQKQYLELKGKPVLYYALNAFEQSEIIDEVILVVGNAQEDYCREEIVEKYGFQKVQKIVEGGAERYHSVYCGLCAAEKKEGYVFIHDGARPFVDEEMLCRAYEAVKREGACVVGMPVKDTIKIVDAELYAKETPPRKDVWIVQTPQVFSYPLVFASYKKLLDEKRDQKLQVTDDAMVVELLSGHSVKMVEGSYRNIKITTPEDLRSAEAFLTEAEEKCAD